VKSKTLAPLSTPSIARHEATKPVHCSPYSRSASLNDTSSRRPVPSACAISLSAICHFSTPSAPSQNGGFRAR
jgi:hypothetical protein